MRMPPLIIAAVVGVVATCAAVERVRPRPSADVRRSRPARVTTQKIERALKSPADIDLVDKSLKDALSDLSESTQIPIEIDLKALTENGIGTDTTVSLMLHGPALQSALDLLLEPLGLTYIVGNGVLKVTSIEVAESSLQARQYDVTDLIDFSNEQRREADYQLLRRAIMSATGALWEDFHGKGGTILLDIESQAVSVNQSQKSHRAISGLLMTLKRMKQTNANLPR